MAIAPISAAAVTIATYAAIAKALAAGVALAFELQEAIAALHTIGGSSY